MTLAEDQQAPDPGDMVQLFQLDMTMLKDANGDAGTVIYFTSAPLGGVALVFDGNTYQPLPVEVEGYEITGKGQIPQPKMKVSNVLGIISSLLTDFGTINGSKLTRIRTFLKYLDGQPSADPTVFFPVDIFTIERKTEHNRVIVEWDLKAAMDQAGKKLPGRQVLRDTCLHTYRLRDLALPSDEPYPGGPFTYTNASCPYNDSFLFDSKGQVTSDPSDDKCGKRLSDCKKRFNAVVDSPLPIRSFPGVARLRLG